MTQEFVETANRFAPELRETVAEDNSLRRLSDRKWKILLRQWLSALAAVCKRRFIGRPVSHRETSSLATERWRYPSVNRCDYGGGMVVFGPMSNGARNSTTGGRTGESDPLRDV